MIHTKTSGGVLSLLYKPLCVALLLLGLFGLVRLRSNVVALHYEIRNLEEKKTEAVKNTKLLLAERAKFASLDKIAAAFQDDRGEKVVSSAGENLFGNRVRVVHVKRNNGPQPYRASLDETVRK